MDDVWNSWETQAPAVCNVKTLLYHDQVRELKDLVFDVWHTLNNQKCLHAEAAILSQFLYKYKRLFRHDKGFQNLVKVKQSLEKYQKLDLLFTVTLYKNCFPAKLPALATHAFLPTKQMLQWILVRLISFSKLFSRIMELTQQAGRYIYLKLNLGWSMGNMIFALSLASRFSVLAKYLVTKSVEWYKNFYSYLDYFQQTAEFIPDSLLPRDLKSLLGDVDLSPAKKKSSINEIFEVINLCDEDEDDDEVEVLDVSYNEPVADAGEPRKDSKKGKKLLKPTNLPHLKNEDVGAPVKGAFHVNTPEHQVHDKQEERKTLGKKKTHGKRKAEVKNSPHMRQPKKKRKK